MTEPCGCLCLPNPAFIDCIQYAPITQGDQTCKYHWWSGVLHPDFSPYAPIRWTLGYSPSGSASPTTTLYPVVSGPVLDTNVWESDVISQDGGAKVFFFRLTINGLGPGDVLLEMVFTAHPVSGFPSTVEFVNQFHLGQTISGSHYGLGFPVDWIEADYSARKLVVDRLLIDFPCRFRLTPVQLRTYIPGTRYTKIDIEYECTSAGFGDPLGYYVGQTFSGSCNVPSGSSVYLVDNLPTLYGTLYAPNGRSVSTSCVIAVNCSTSYGANGTVAFSCQGFLGWRVGGPRWFESIFPIVSEGGANVSGGFNPTYGVFTILGAS